MNRKLIYLHGFGSSGGTSTAKSLQELLPDWTVIAPDIPVDPTEALFFLKDLCQKENPDLVVGTSMGGMYAQQMRGFKRICINPAFDISQHNDILKEGTFEFLNPRKNGEKTFTITAEIIQHAKEMETHQFDDITEESRELVYGLFADNDTVVNCEDIFLQHYKHVIHFHGEHRLNRQVVEETLIPVIQELTKKNYNYNELYDIALNIAIQAHAGQKDISGRAYIMHPIRVSERCKNMRAKVVALLHDTIEDTEVTAEYLRGKGFPEEIINGILSVTARKGESYDEFVRRAAENPIGKEVKKADIEDNMDIRRLAELTDSDVARLRKYLRAWHYLNNIQ